MLLRVLGPLETRVPGEDGPRRVARKPAALLARLLLNRGEWVDCGRLVEAIWPDRVPPRSALSNIKSYVWQLRRDLLPAHDRGPTIEARAGAYRLCADPAEVDVECFRRRTADGRTAMARGDATDAVRHLEAAAALWRGTPFAELPDEVVAPVVAELEELRWEVRETLADALTAVRRHREAIALLRDLTAADPLREGPWARLVMTLVRAGRRSEALATYDDARRVLADELGVDPGRALVEAHRHALAEPAALRVRCDLPRNVPDFTGRSLETARLTELSRSATTTVPVVVVDGMPGVGKSAFAVHVAHRIAGEFPDGQLFVDLAPDGEPLGADVLLARLLRSTGVRDIPEAVAERAAAWRAHLAGRRVLLVLDDASSSDQVRPLLPGSAGCMVLITARTRVLHLDAIEPVTLTPLPAAQTAALFRSCTGASADDVVREVVRRTGGLPAAVRAATALYRTRPQWTSEQFVTRLREETTRTAITLVEPAYRELDDHQRRLLHAVAAERDCGLSDRETGRVLEHLVDHHLVVAQSPGRYAVHPVVRDYARHVTPALRQLTAV
ncbi:BTAD domain-containing putative transcriptional regulator [Lentzea sp. DG1S-22]|uniref:AfsR/SARP family transcriptional regulator n=1 Tax=Lentzea sp. DG1S-22 TaxID=3108822 RepID=UPI002E769353|nr:BTAD domain-containing putative transcriptional regulator [Lentzea sp. DG1S-22]WVH84285.1 BTAD domain-containing putative transcriptional regulator [Lentzea sp. DG1S-22]